MKTFVVAKALIVNEAGDVLLLRRSKTDERRPLQWDFPGGWADEGEDVSATVLRETKEETGLTVTKPKLAYAFTEVEEKGGSGTWLAFLIRIQGRPAVTISPEHDNYAWMPLKEAYEALVYERQRRMIGYVLEHDLLKEGRLTP